MPEGLRINTAEDDQKEVGLLSPSMASQTYTKGNDNPFGVSNILLVRNACTDRRSKAGHGMAGDGLEFSA